jgi:BlaI family penicillinase repressor
MKITDAEFTVMEALWRGQPLSAEDLIAAVLSEASWGEATVKTLINRLLRKGAIRSERANGRHSYHAVLERADYVQAESETLLDRLFGGQLAPLVAQFADRKTLSAEDRRRLKALIDRLDDDA